MDTVHHGGCLCGRVRYEVTGAIGAAGVCHCADCRRVTGGAFHVGVRVETGRFRLVTGAPRGFTKRADSGRELTRHFCADCGSPIHTSSSGHPGHVFVKAGSFDDPTVIEPGYETWVESRVAWSSLPPGLPSFGRGRT